MSSPTCLALSCLTGWTIQPCVYVDSFIIHQVHTESLCNRVVWPVYAAVPFLKQRQLRAAIVHLLKASLDMMSAFHYIVSLREHG